MMRSMPLWGTRLGAAVLLLAMLLTQSLGLVHRSVHAKHPSDGLLGQQHRHDHASSAHNNAHRAQRGQDHRSWLEPLFTNHKDGVTCAVYDAQTTIYGGFIPVVQVFIAQAAIQLIAFSQITSTARAAALFEARGPPAAL
jgi:hypothetical protein